MGNGNKHAQLAPSVGQMGQKLLWQIMDCPCHHRAGVNPVVKNREGCYENKPSAAGSCVMLAQLCEQACADLSSCLRRVCLQRGSEGETSWQAGKAV